MDIVSLQASSCCTEKEGWRLSTVNVAWMCWLLVTGEPGLLLDIEPENETYPHRRDPCVGKAVMPPGSNGSDQTAWIPPGKVEGREKVEVPKWMGERLTVLGTGDAKMCGGLQLQWVSCSCSCSWLSTLIISSTSASKLVGD